MTMKTSLTTLTLGVAPIVWRLLIRRKSNTTPRQIIDPLARGQRYRDGAVTYNLDRGVHINVDVEDPRGLHDSRYQRRHRPKQHKQTKSWMK